MQKRKSKRPGERVELRKKIIDAVPALISYVDHDLKYLLVNRRYSDWFGVSVDEIEGRTVREVVGESVFNAMLPEISAVLAGQPVRFERMLEYRLGGNRFVSGNLLPDVDDAGRVRGYFSLLTDETYRFEMESELRNSQERFSKMLNFIPMSISLSSLSDHRYVDVNEAFVKAVGRRRDDIIGKTGPELGLRMPEDQQREFIERLMSEQCVSDFEADITTLDRPSRTIVLSAVILEIAGESLLASFGYDITERKRAERALKDMTAQMFQLQEDERRRLSHELHDTTAQKLSAQLLNLSYMKKLLAESNTPALDILTETISLAEDALGEIRTFSYVLHPPLLDKVGLTSALRWLIEGFSQRSGIKVELASTELGKRLPQDMEGAIFRIVQEALTNIQRHSESKSAFIMFEQTPERVHLEVRDKGVGFNVKMEQNETLMIDEGERTGVGIMSIRERIRQFGGDLSIQTGPAGTKLIVDIPVK